MFKKIFFLIIPVVYGVPLCVHPVLREVFNFSSHTFGKYLFIFYSENNSITCSEKTNELKESNSTPILTLIQKTGVKVSSWKRDTNPALGLADQE